MNMKRHVCLCLILMTGPVALAQQPAEWRPNIAEDNKAATWENTASFLSTTLMYQGEDSPARVDVDVRCRMGVVSAYSPSLTVGLSFAGFSQQDKLENGLVVSTVSPGGLAASAGLKPQDVILSFDHHNIGKQDNLASLDNLANEVSVTNAESKVDVEYLRTGKTFDTFITLARWQFFTIHLWDFAAIDPLSISVALGQTSSAIRFKGTNNGPAGKDISGSRIINSPIQKTDTLIERTCSAIQTKCGDPTPVLEAEGMSFKDVEISKRFARALQHAALLCGGTKAVSPF